MGASQELSDCPPPYVPHASDADCPTASVVLLAEQQSMAGGIRVASTTVNVNVRGIRADVLKVHELRRGCWGREAGAGSILSRATPAC